RISGTRAAVRDPGSDRIEWAVSRILETLSEHEHGAHGTSPARAPHLDLLLECARPLVGPARYRLSGIDVVRLGRGDERAARIIGGAIELAIPDGWMSQHHAELTRTSGAWSLLDLGSKNGTWINGARVGAEPAPLCDGDLLQLGHSFLRMRTELAAPVVDASGPLALRTMSP